MTVEQSIQDRDFADTNCFGCGPANGLGLRIKSFARADGTVVARWSPGAEHSNGAGAVCGGVLGTILDCHGAAAAGVALSATAQKVGRPPGESSQAPVAVERLTYLLARGSIGCGIVGAVVVR
jgi:acyl-coenzyme A thioesterase PaaI-like protein